MSNNNDSVYMDLARGLAKCAKDSVNMPSPGADKYAQEQQRDAAARSLADPIYEAIKRGLHGVLFFSVDELNKIDKPLDDILYVCNDAGFLFRGLGNAQLSVTRNTFLRWNGYWELVQFSTTTIINNETGGNVRQEIENHNNAVDSHPDIRQLIDSEASSRDDAIATHNTSEDAHEDIRQIIADEVDERTDADTALQQQIDAITSKSDVVAIVGTYVDLLALDTSTMFDNDIVKVLSDESRQGKKTYYSWDIASEAWIYIGSEAETYTKSEVNSLLNSKANKVSGATNGHLAGLDANGNLTDSGVSPSDISSSIFIAEYGTTTIAQIEAAYNANKAMLVKMGGGNPGIAFFTTRYTSSGANSYWFYRKYGRDYGANEDQHYAYVYIDSTGWHDYSFTSPKNRHSSTTDEYGAGSENAYGHVQLTSSVTQNSNKAVRSGAVYDALQDIRGDMEGKQDVLASNSLAFIYKPTSGSASKFLNEQGNFVSVDGEIPVQKIVVGQMLRGADNCLYSYGSNNTLFVMTSWVTSRVSGTAYQAILRTVNTDTVKYIKVLITAQYVVYTVLEIGGFLYNKWTLEDSINTDVVLVTYKQDVIFPSFNALINAVHNRRDVLLVAYTADGEEQEYYRLQWWKLYDSDNVYSFMFSNYMEATHTFKSYTFDYNTGGVLLNVFPSTFRPISSVGTNNIDNGAVTNAKLSNYAVTSEKLEASAVISGKIANGAVGTTKLADNAVTDAKIDNLAVIRDKIAFGAVSADKQACGYFDWTIDTQYRGGSRNYIDLSGSQGSTGSDTGSGESINSLNTTLANSSTSIRYTDVMIRFNVTYGTSSNIAYVYCNVGSLPKFTLFKLKVVAVGHSIIIRFRTNATTEALAAAYVNENVYYNTVRDYTIDAGYQEDICFFRGNDSGSNCRLYLISNWT